ncbi:MAG: ATP-dependent helicase HrpB [Rhodothermales bacterium]|nr:ATP-dependent helicase HrpB [Rhodothermales bacterium]MBO6778553.1 ATP-dependent helicase HrpB [Rhodothermales bacterium]
MSISAPDLPVRAALPDLLRELTERTEAVLQAPPGAGKTTLVPLALLDAPFTGGGRILVLEPRRLAARAAARRMAQLRREQVGETVGYRVRQESRIGPNTRIEVITEGILIRLLQDDPSLEGVAAVVFDEFHERSLQADLGLALTLDARSAFRPELRVLVMSATLDGARVSRMLNDAPVISSEGRMFPVDVKWLDRVPQGRVEDTVASAVRNTLPETEGDVLVFLPGAGEIRRTAERLEGLAADIRPLYGALPFNQQDAAIKPSPAGRRKVVLSTDIAETSLTIEGVRVVIDCGLARRPLFEPNSGMTRLVTMPTSRASAEQRAGRAGRLAPGTCLRLWTRAEHAARRDFEPPEILGADLAQLLLELAVWGTTADALRWMDPPEERALAGASELLNQLGALDGDRISAQGRRMVRFGAHPRLAHMLLAATSPSAQVTATQLAALIEEGDPLRNASSADVALRLPLRDKRLQRTAAEFARRLKAPKADVDPAVAGMLLARAYPDRIAQRTAEGRFRLRNGRQVHLHKGDPLCDADFLAVAHTGGRNHQVFLAAPLEASEVEAVFEDQITEETLVSWDASSDRAAAVRRRALGAVVLSEASASDVGSDEIARALMEQVRERGLHLLPWDKASRQLQDRLNFLHARDPDWPSRSEAWLTEHAEEWLLQHLTGMARLSDLRKLDLAEALLTGMDWSMRQALDGRVPTHLQVPTGSRIRIDYSDPQSPVLAVRIQEVFGMTDTPRIEGVPVTMHLLSPAQRPLQITTNLKGFWESSYFDVRKDMRGRYPKHYWPENPLEAEPTRRAKPRKR